MSEKVNMANILEKKIPRYFHIKVYFFGEFQEFLEKNSLHLASIFLQINYIHIFVVCFSKKKIGKKILAFE
jgi:hypothetical protein